MTVPSLLPQNATSFERALESATARIGDLDAPFDQLWNAQTCPVAFLPWLASSLSVDEWDDNWSEDAKRAVIAASVAIHRRKGTIAAVKRALVAAGYGDAHLEERAVAQRHDGTVPRNGTRTRAPANHWAEYRVVLSRPVSIEQAARVRRILNAVAPARCHLKALDYQRALNLHDATVPRNGTYTRGIA